MNEPWLAGGGLYVDVMVGGRVWMRKEGRGTYRGISWGLTGEVAGRRRNGRLLGEPTLRELRKCEKP